MIEWSESQATPKEDNNVLIGTLISAYDKRGSLLALAKFALNRPDTFDVISKGNLVEAIDKELGRKI